MVHRSLGVSLAQLLALEVDLLLELSWIYFDVLQIYLVHVYVFDPFQVLSWDTTLDFSFRFGSLLLQRPVASSFHLNRPTLDFGIRAQGRAFLGLLIHTLLDHFQICLFFCCFATILGHS